jgi:LysR family transcriptional regulator, hydrogen peroxide-inducible genes activator
VCRLSGAQERSGFRATSLETLRQMVAAGVGVTLLPALSVHEPIAQSPNIRLIPFRAPAPSRQIALAWRKSSALDGFLRTLADAIGTLARAQLPTL